MGLGLRRIDDPLGLTDWLARDSVFCVILLQNHSLPLKYHDYHYPGGQEKIVTRNLLTWTLWTLVTRLVLAISDIIAAL